MGQMEVARGLVRERLRGDGGGAHAQAVFGAQGDEWGGVHGRMVGWQGELDA